MVLSLWQHGEETKWIHTRHQTKPSLKSSNIIGDVGVVSNYFELLASKGHFSSFPPKETLLAIKLLLLLVLYYLFSLSLSLHINFSSSAY